MSDTPDTSPAPELAEPDYAEPGRKIFAREAAFRTAADKSDSLPGMEGLEIAFAGRSNVGKSSLVNALTGRNTLARTSHTPGRTQQLIFFDVGGLFTLVDMPGYGYAAVSKQKVAAWTQLVRDYLRGRANLARVLVLVDARHGPKPNDAEIMDMLDKAAVSYQVVLTKADAPKKTELDAVIARTREQIARRPAAYPEIVVTSSRTAEGVADLRGAIARLLAERGVALPAPPSRPEA
ncbi:ribosome biogenesis GTP-binding protein YihA/YsxC [Salinarimonas sp.]|uniref:ribosome biogenesis GTP-binding protein YihA/YsxC n=1 Tax=Salinarimonas sp. TaxID=2766526 RepID=UPI0032D953DD